MADQQIRQFTYVHANRIIPPGTRVTTHCGIKHLDAIHRVLERYKLLDRFVQGPLGHFLEIPLSLHLTAPQLISHVLVKEVKFSGACDDEMWFEIGGTPYRYGKQKFILISGLRFGVIDKENLKARPIEPNSLRARLFPSHKKGVSGDDMKLLLCTRHDLISEDVLKLVYIFVVNLILLGQDERVQVDDFFWTLTEDLHAFEAFPWGMYIYSKSQYYIHLATSDAKLTGAVGKKVNIYGFVWAFQWWLIETFPWIQNKWVVRISDQLILRCRKWLSNKRPQIKNYYDCLTNDVRGLSSTLEPTDAERETEFWRCFNPHHSVGVDVYKFGGGGSDEEEKNGGDEEEVSRIHEDTLGIGWQEDTDKDEDEDEDEEELVHKEARSEVRQEGRLPDNPHHRQYETRITEMLTLTLEMLRGIDGKISQMRTQLQRLERGQAALEKSDPDHSDDGNEQHQGGDQIDPTYGLQKKKVVRVRRQPMRDRVSSQCRRPPYTDVTRSKKTKTDVLVEGADMDLVPAVLDPTPDVETVPLVPKEGGTMILPP